MSRNDFSCLASNSALQTHLLALYLGKGVTANVLVGARVSVGVCLSVQELWLNIDAVRLLVATVSVGNRIGSMFI